MKSIILVAALISTGTVFAATPVVTNDPRDNADMPFEMKKNIACEITSDRMFNGDKIENVMGGVEMSYGEYTYYYYMQDVLDFCVNNVNKQGA